MFGTLEVESFSAIEFLEHVKARTRFIVAICAVAGILALIVSLLIPKEYTARASLVIDPPAGSDARMSMTASPVYFESLRAYETLASSDSLFLRAAEKFHLRDAPIETLKRRVLRVTKLRETKILEIAVTLPDPIEAQAMAQFLGEQTVQINRESTAGNDRELRADAEKNADAARQKLDQVETQWRVFSKQKPVESLRSEAEALSDARDRVRRDLVDSRAELAEAGVRREGEAEVRARVENLEKQDRELERQIEQNAATLSDRQSRGDELESRVHEARTAYESAEAHVRELQASEGMRNDRLRLIDPGVVPEKASFPQTGLNVALAIAVAMIVCFVYLALTFHTP
jgi:uncharacterized protein involved in exopolysaccharide biosynthesis